MKCRPSLKKSIIFFFVVTCVILVAGYTYFLSHYLTRGFELFVEFRLEEASTNYLKEYAENSLIPLPGGGHITGYDSYGSLPGDIRIQLDETELKSKPFLYAYANKTHYKIRTLQRKDGKTIYMVYRSFEGDFSQDAHRKFDFYYLYTPALGGLLAIAMVLVLAFYLFKRIATPVEFLNEWALTLSPENLDREPVRFKYDEFNNVADLLLSTSRRLVAGVDREKRFQKYASHELRTPIAVIQNNLELMERLGITEDNRFKSSHARMTKAVRNMKHLTVALLWLSRETDAPMPEEDVDLDAFIHEIIDENVYLLEGKAITLATDLQPVTLRASRILARIILTNLVRNAFQHSCDGDVRIKSRPGVIEVANHVYTPSGECETANPDGYGLGLQLSQQLVCKIGWEIEVIEKDGEFIVRVLIQPCDTA